MGGQDLGVGVRFGVEKLVNIGATVFGITVSVRTFSTVVHPIMKIKTSANAKYFLIIFNIIEVFDTTRGQRVCPRRTPLSGIHGREKL